MITLYELNEVFDISGTLLTTRRSRAALPWESTKDAGLWALYLYNHSGEKWISPIVNKMLTDGELSSANKTTIANIISDMYTDNWTKLYDAMFAEYNPIENYNRVELRTGTETLTDTPHNWQKTNITGASGGTQTETQTPTNWQKTSVTGATSELNTETQTPTNWTKTNARLASNNEETTEHGIYGFNSASAVNADTETTTAASEETETQAGTYETETLKEADTHTDTETQTGTYTTQTITADNARTDSETQSGTFEHETEYDTDTRISGNIGVTTTQQMIEQELLLREHNFYDRVFADIDKVLTLDIY